MTKIEHPRAYHGVSRRESRSRLWTLLLAREVANKVRPQGAELATESKAASTEDIHGTHT